MTLYAVSFRLEKNDRYETRRESFVAALKVLVDPILNRHDWWDQTTSFILLISNQPTAQDLLDRAEENSFFNVRTDIALAINLDADDYGTLGEMEDEEGLIDLMRGRK